MDQHSVRMLTAKLSDDLDSCAPLSPNPSIFAGIIGSVRALPSGSHRAFSARGHWRQRSPFRAKGFPTFAGSTGGSSEMDRGFMKFQRTRTSWETAGPPIVGELLLPVPFCRLRW